MPIDRANYPGVPDDFPIETTPSALSGAQPKMGLVEEDGKFYAPGTSPSEVSAAFELCADLVPQMAAYCERKLPAFGDDQGATFEAALQGLVGKGWCSAAQSEWVMRKAVEQLGWVPRKLEG